MNTPSSNITRIEPVANKRQLKTFITMPWTIYAGDPHWIAPLLFEQKQRLSTQKNPFFEHARWQAWTAWRDGRIVGRISAQIDRLHQEQHQDDTGYFGMLEAENKTETFSLLLQTAENWLRSQGMRRARGPLNLSINEEAGLLVDGFETPPFIMMGHARKYYGPCLEEAGYCKAQDLLAYHVRPDFDAPAVMTRLREKTGHQIRVRPLKRKQLKQEFEVLRDIFNDAWSDNWGFVPFTRAEFADIGQLVSLLVDDDFIQIAEIDQRPVAMIVAMPNINEAIRDLNGKLLPVGWAKLLWRLKIRYPGTARVPLMGVRKEFHYKRLGTALAFRVIDAVRQALIRRGITRVELSWILENNISMCNIIETISGIAYKRYRIYEKSL